MPETIISQKKSFLDLNESELNEILTKTGEKKFRIKQINNWIYNQNVRSWDEMINLPISMNIGQNIQIQLRRNHHIDYFKL